jgi:hypothetical protein
LGHRVWATRACIDVHRLIRASTTIIRCLLICFLNLLQIFFCNRIQIRHNLRWMSGCHCCLISWRSLSEALGDRTASPCFSISLWRGRRFKKTTRLSTWNSLIHNGRHFVYCANLLAVSTENSWTCLLELLCSRWPIGCQISCRIIISLFISDSLK